MALKKSIESFCSVFPRKASFGNVDFGTIEINEIPNSNLPLDLEFKGSIKEYFSHTLISDDAMIGGEFMMNIYSLNNVKKGLEGWSWYVENNQRYVNKNWLNTWIPVGDRNGSIVFVKSELNSANIYASFTGGFEPFLIADSLKSLLDVLTQCLRLEKDFNYDTQNEDYEPKTDFINKVKSICEANFSKDSNNGFMEFFFG